MKHGVILQVPVLKSELTKLGFKKSGNVLTYKGNDKTITTRAKAIIDAINILTKSKIEVKEYDGFTDII